MDIKSKIHDLTILYLEKKVHLFADVEDCFNKYIETENQLTNLFGSEEKKMFKECFDEGLKIMDNFLDNM